MSKNEFLNAVSIYLDELANNQGGLSDEKLKEIIAREIEGQLERYTEGVILEDDLDEKIEEAIEDFAGREGYATESMVQRAIDDSIDDLDIDYRVDNAVGDAVEDEIDRRDLVERSEVEDIVDDFLDDKGYEATIDTLIQEKDALLERLVALEMDAVLGKLEAIVG